MLRLGCTSREKEKEMYYCPKCQEEYNSELSEALNFQCFACYGELEEN